MEVRDDTGYVLSKTLYIRNELSQLLQEKQFTGTEYTTITYTYNKNGQIVSKVDQLGNTTTYQYDSLSRLLTMTLPNGLQSKNTYDLKNRITKREIIAPTKTLSTRYVYDNDDRIIEEIDDNNYSTHYAYNELGQVVSMTDKKGIITTYTYDYRGKVLSETVAGKTTQYAYNIIGKMNKMIDPNGNQTLYTYDRM